MMIFRSLSLSVFVFAGVSCSTTAVTHDPQSDLALLWVNHAAEYDAGSRQVYQAAERALEKFAGDPSWSAMPGQRDAEGLRPAVILDVDETVISNAKFQLAFERPMAQWKLEKWNDEHTSDPVPGVTRFVLAAQAAGVAVFFVTNRPCDPIDGDPDPCPQKKATVRDIGELGIETDEAHLLLAREHGWTSEKLTRRQHIAKTHRIIMLIGDDLSDFIPCVRATPRAPCTEPSSKAHRKELVAEFSRFWGYGWYILPGPMHGSWTSAL